MSVCGVIINLAAGRGNGKGAALITALRKAKIPNLKVITEFADLQPAMVELGAAKVDTLFISSGDGTLQGVVTCIAESKIFDAKPRLCILPHGTTNLSAIDLGFTRRRVADQCDFIANPQPLKIIRRPTLKVLNPRGQGPRHGFSFGAGAAATATRITQTNFNDKGRKGQFAALRVMLGAVAAALFTKPDRHDKIRIDRPYEIEAAMDNVKMCSGDQLMFIATTLDKQFFNSQPFWGGRNGPIRASAFSYPAPNLLRWMLPIMYGKEFRTMPSGSSSLSGQSFTITCPESYVMDGEFFDGPLAEPLRVETGPLFEFITA